MQKSPIISGSFAERDLLRKETCNLRRPVHLRHPVDTVIHYWVIYKPP